MKLSLTPVVAAVFCLSLAAQTPPPKEPQTKVKSGDMAPDFTLPSTTGKDIKLSDYRGEKNVVLAFVVKALTGGWTQEAKGYQADIQKLGAEGNQVLMISTDDVDTLKRWAKELNVDYPMLSDATGRIAEEYGVLMPGQKLAMRTTFVIDRSGKVRYVEQGRTAVDTTGAVTACSRLGKH